MRTVFFTEENLPGRGKRKTPVAVYLQAVYESVSGAPQLSASRLRRRQTGAPYVACRMTLQRLRRDRRLPDQLRMAGELRARQLPMDRSRITKAGAGPSIGSFAESFGRRMDPPGTEFSMMTTSISACQRRRDRRSCELLCGHRAVSFHDDCSSAAKAQPCPVPPSILPSRQSSVVCAPKCRTRVIQAAALFNL